MRRVPAPPPTLVPPMYIILIIFFAAAPGDKICFLYEVCIYIGGCMYSSYATQGAQFLKEKYQIDI